MATRTIANAGGNWNTAATWVEGAVPTNADDVVATATSGQLTLDAGGQCRTIDFTNYTGTFTFNNSTYGLRVGNPAETGGSGVCFRFVAGMTVTIGSDSCGLYFIQTSGTWDCYFASKTIGGSSGGIVDFGGYNYGNTGTATWTIKDTLSISGYDHTMYFNSGTLTIDNAVTTIGGTFNFYITGAFTKTLNMGTATWNIGSGQGTFRVFDEAKPYLTLNCGTSTIDFGGTYSALYGGDKTYYNINSDYIDNMYIYGNNTFNNVTLYSEYNNQRARIELGGNQTINGSLTAYNLESISSGKIWCRMIFRSSTLGVPRTLTVATMGTLRSIDFRDITGAGAGNWNLSAISGGSGDAGGNSGITFTTGAPMYWHHASGAGTATGYYSGTSGSGTYVADLRWFLATNGGGGAGRRPLPQDTAVFDVNSFDGAGLTVQIDKDYYAPSWTRMCGSIDFSGATNNPTMNFGLQTDFFGNITIKSGMTVNGQINYYGRGAATITSAAVSCPGLYIYSIGGSLTQADAYTTTDEIHAYYGTYSTGNYNLTALSFVADGGTTATLGTSTVSLTGTGTVFDAIGSRFPGPGEILTMDYGYIGQPFVYVPAKNTVDTKTMDYGYMGQPFDPNYNTGTIGVDQCNIFLTNTTATAKTFNGEGNDFNNLWIASSASVPVTTITSGYSYGQISFNNIYLYGQGTLTFGWGATYTLKGGFGLWGGYLQTGGNYTRFGGVSGTLLTVNSNSAGSPFYLVKSSGNVCCDYMSFRDCYASGGARYFAGSHSTSVSGNTGWLITDALDIQIG